MKKVRYELIERMVVITMENYLMIIRYATLFFPIISFLFTMPFILVEYHKYGSISFLKSAITYLFVFYLLCSYFLVILPLPKISEVAKLTTPRTQFIPFSFLMDFMKHSSFDITNIHTYLPAMKETYFYVPIFNILLTIPFGMFLRYYFKCDKRKTVVYTFLLSLFFEITQLTGLYFIYPRGYRLFDIDDLLLNTFGGLLGFFLVKPFTYVIPNMDTINDRAREKGKTISGFRRTVAFLLDIFLLVLIQLITILVVKDNIYLSVLITILYYFIVPLFLDMSTLGEKFLNIQVLDYQNRKNIGRLFFRKILFILFYILIPSYTSYVIFSVSNDYVREFVGLIVIGCFFFMYFLTIMKYLFTGKEMIYEKISKTRLVSTIR